MDIKQLSLSEILTNIEFNQYEIPDFQRKFVWKPENIILLLDSIFKNYPIGAFLTLSSNNIKLSSEKLNIEVKNYIKNSKGQDIYYVLDGQQRLTSIARAFYRGDKKNSYYLNMENFCLFCLSEQQKTFPNKFFDYQYEGEAIFEYRKNKNDDDIPLLEKKLIRVDLLKNSNYDDPRVFNLDAFLNNYFLEKYKINHSYFHEIRNLIREKISSTFYSYKLIIQQLEKNETIDAICRIFETINNTGVKLTIFDLLVAKTYSNNFNLREISDNFYPLLNPIGLNQDNFLHLALMLKQISRGVNPTLTRDGLFNLNHDDFSPSKIDTLSQACINYKKWLKDGRIYQKAVLDMLSLLLISIEGHRIISGQESIFIKYKNILEKFLFTRSYSKAAYNKSIIPYDYKILMEIFKRESNDSEYAYYINMLFKDNLIPKITPNEIFETKNTQKVFAIVLSLLYKNIYKDISGEVYDDISILEEHHIVPKKTCLQYGLDIAKFNSVANIILIDSTLNKKISDSNPDLYLENLLLKHNDPNIFIQHKLLGVSQNLKENFINYNTFLFKRAEELANLFNKYIEDNNISHN